MVEKEYKVEINNSTLIGNCVLYRNIYMVTNENVGRFKFRNSLLPEANSAIAIPLVNQDEVLGVLEIQDVRKDEDVTFAIESFSFQIIADHIAVAIYNAQQFAQKGTK